MRDGQGGSINLVVRADVEQMYFQFVGFRRADEFKHDAEIVSGGTRPAAGEITGEFVRSQRGMMRVGFELPERGVQRVEQTGLAPGHFADGARELGGPDEFHLPRNSRIRSAAEPRLTLPRR